MEKQMMNETDSQEPKRLHKPVRAEELKPAEIFLYNCEACSVPGDPDPGGGAGGAPPEEFGDP